MYSKENEDGTVTILIPRDTAPTGYGSDGKHTTFTAGNGPLYRVRNIEEDTAGSFALSLLVVVGMSLGLALGLLDQDPKGLSNLAVPFGIFFFAAIVGGIGSNKFHWKQGFMLAIVAVLVTRAPNLRNEDTMLALTFAAIIMIGHAVSWVRHAVWEPFVGTALFLVLFLANRFGFVPNLVSVILFAVIALLSFFWMGSIWKDAKDYRKGWRTMREY